MIIFQAVLLRKVKEFITTLSDEDKVKFRGIAHSMELGVFNSLYIKTLNTPIKELIIKNYRFIFFINKNEIWFVGAFIKKSAKTPKSEIENAKKLYDKIIRLK